LSLGLKVVGTVAKVVGPNKFVLVLSTPQMKKSSWGVQAKYAASSAMCRHLSTTLKHSYSDFTNDTFSVVCSVMKMMEIFL